MRNFTVLLALGLALAQSASADNEISAVESERIVREDASDLAAELSDRAFDANPYEGTDGSEKMQVVADQLGTVGALLDGELRAGKTRAQTEPLYRELRRLRLEAIRLAMSGEAQLPEDAAEFEALLQELGRYQRGE
jgi:hypothetical protein